jgi:hypothetical protein
MKNRYGDLVHLYILDLHEYVKINKTFGFNKVQWRCEETDEQYEYNMPLMNNLNGSGSSKTKGQHENNLSRKK